MHYRKLDCGSLVWFLDSCWHVELDITNLSLLVIRLIMPQPEWWPTRRWPPLTPTEKDSQLYHTVKDLKSVLLFVKKKTKKMSCQKCHLCYVGVNHKDKNKVWYWSRIKVLNLGMAMWLVINTKISDGWALLLIGTQREDGNGETKITTWWQHEDNMIDKI